MNTILSVSVINTVMIGVASSVLTNILVRLAPYVIFVVMPKVTRMLKRVFPIRVHINFGKPARQRVKKLRSRS